MFTYFVVRKIFNFLASLINFHYFILFSSLFRLFIIQFYIDDILKVCVSSRYGWLWRLSVRAMIGTERGTVGGGGGGCTSNCENTCVLLPFPHQLLLSLISSI